MSVRLLGLSSDAALGRDLQYIEITALELVEESEQLFNGYGDESARQLIRSSLSASILLIGLLRSATGWSRNVVRTICKDEAHTEINHYLQFERAAIEGDRNTLQTLLNQDSVPDEYLHLVQGIFYQSKRTVERELLPLLQKPVFRRQDILRLHVTIGLGRIAIASEQLTTRKLKASNTTSFTARVGVVKFPFSCWLSSRIT